MFVEKPEPSQIQPATKSGRKVLWIMILLFGLPYVAAMYVYLNRDEISLGKSSNYGHIVTPSREIPDIHLATLEGSAFSFADQNMRGKWLLVSVASSACEQTCLDNMYKLRQLRKAVGEESLRLQRVLLLTDNLAVNDLPSRLSEYNCVRTQLHDKECLQIVRYDEASQRVMDVLRLDNREIQDAIFIIDPAGQYMMHYPSDADPGKMLKDIQRLLKVSRIG